jgi:hypothetical protein
LRAKEKIKRAPKGSEDLEDFLSATQIVIIDQVFEKREGNDSGKLNIHSENLKNCCKNLEGTKTVVIPTDKTNSFRCVDIRDYKDWAIKHLLKNGKEIPKSKLVQALGEANELLEALEDIMSEDEYYFVKESLNSKAIPSPKLLIKDHKEINDDGNYPTRLVVPATNFTAAFSKLGYIGIKKIIDEAGINYTSKTIVQASHLKTQIESLNIKRDGHTIFSLDIEAFYPSVTYGLVERAIEFFSRTLGEKEKATIKECLKMVAFGMGNTLLTFVDKYYEYDGEREIQDKGLTIGGYELAWLANLVAAFVLENCEDFFEDTIYDGIYRDDGLVIMDGQKTNAEIGEWLNTFQGRVNQVTGYEGLVFTVSIWRQEQSNEKLHPKATIHKSSIFPFLDMKLSWSEEGDLRFGVYLKSGQQLKYLNNVSSHPPHCFKAITKGVFGRLASLTSLTNESRYKSIKDLYPRHFEALDKAGLAPKYIPTLQEILDRNKGKEERKEEKLERDKQRNRSVYFCIGYSNVWKEPIHKTLKKLRNKFDLKWLRISMSYHRFPNMRDLLAGDLSKKLSEGVESMDFQVRDCNCRGGRGPRKCQYGDFCRMPIVVYKVTCKMMNKFYIGNTQQHLKSRMRGHFQDVKKLMEKEVHSDLYA